MFVTAATKKGMTLSLLEADNNKQLHSVEWQASGS